MLPSEKSKGLWSDSEARYGNVAMELLMNGLFKLGARRENLEIKIFGGGKMTPTMSDVGSLNIAFVKKFLSDEGYSIVSEDVGLEFPRKVNYFPKTGKVMVKRMRSMHKKTIANHDIQYAEKITSTENTGDVELF